MSAAARVFVGRNPTLVSWTRGLGRRELSRVMTRALSVSSVHRKPDKVTHTGQQWTDDDYRNIRFTDRTKVVNEQFAIDLVAEEPVVVVKNNHTWCDGGRGALGHPKVYVNLDKPEIMDCGYCGKRFLAEKHKQFFENEKLTYEH